MRPLTRVELARAMNVSISCIARWRQQGMPIASNGGHPTYDLGACQRWTAERGLGDRHRIDAVLRRNADSRQAAELARPTIAEVEVVGRLVQANPDRWLELLRDLLLSLPEEEMVDGVQLVEDVWDKLCGHQREETTK
jgi:hypothetical protein